ncbi:hypothetical protein MASR1M45_04890 [Candidatus Kapaibacterium sp.]
MQYKSYIMDFKEAFKTRFGESSGSRTGAGSGAENGKPDYYLTPSSKVYTNPNGTGKKFVVSDESVSKNIIGTDENGNPIISFDNLDAYMLPDESTWDDIIKDILNKIGPYNKLEDGSAYGVDENGNIIYSYGGQGEKDKYGRSNVSKAVEKAVNEIIASGSIDYSTIYIHSHPHPKTGYSQNLTNPDDFDAVTKLNIRGGMMITEASVFFFNSTRGVFMQFKNSDINDFIRGKK